MLKKRPVLPKHSLHQYLPSACCRWPRSKVLSMWMQRLANVAALKARAKDKANSRAKSEWNHEPNHTKKLSTWPPEKWRKRWHRSQPAHFLIHMKKSEQPSDPPKQGPASGPVLYPDNGSPVAKETGEAMGPWMSGYCVAPKSNGSPTKNGNHLLKWFQLSMIVTGFHFRVMRQGSRFQTIPMSRQYVAWSCYAKGAKAIWDPGGPFFGAGTVYFCSACIKEQLQDTHLV